jgi:nucleoside-diphosphate-sugar epimerase/glycosyltransferase involved in cell wall biosynthesis
MSVKNQINSLHGPILVLGASGFIGANLFKMLKAYRDDVFAGIRESKGWRLAEVNEENIVTFDRCDTEKSKKVIETILPKTIFDCTAYGGYSFQDNTNEIYRVNFQSLVDFVTLLSSYGIAAYIHAGSSSEYGLNCTAPLEDDKCEPNSHYSVSKISAATFLHFVGSQRDFPAINFRLYSVYGPLEDSSRLIPNLLKNALAGKLPPFVDPRTSRDFIYIDDVCEAFINAALNITPSIYGESFNIGTGKKTTIAELADLTKKEFSIKEDPQYGTMEARKWDLAEWYANPSKAKRLIGWEAKYDISKGLRATSNWISQLSDEEFKLGSKKQINKNKKSISAIVACYKDDQAIPVMHERLTKTFLEIGVDYEIIFVNDCSPDNTADIIRDISLKDSKVVGISHSRNFGSQMAFKSGMEYSTKDAVVLLDGDLQDPPELIKDFYVKWEEGYEIIYGRRVQREMSWIWGIMYKLFYRIFSKFSYINIPHDAGDFSLIDKVVVSWMLKCKERDLFMRGIRAFVGFKQTGVNYIRPKRMFGSSTNNLMSNVNWAKKGIFSFSDVPLTMLTSFGFISLTLSLIASLIIIALRLFVPDIAPEGITTVLVVILTFGSLTIFSIGLVGEYVAKIMTEVKGRPHYIRTNIIRNGKIIDIKNI